MGPYSHLRYARHLWPRLAAKAGLKNSQEAAANYFLGSIAMDSGYYPGGLADLADTAHLAKPWQFCGLMIKQARSAPELAFALGWLGHAWLDLRSHGELVNPLAGGAYPKGMLRHKQIEWGIDCWQLRQKDAAWLWKIELAPAAGLKLWQRSLKKAFGADLPLKVFARCIRSQWEVVSELRTVWRYTGLTAHPKPGVPEIIGDSLGPVLLYLYVSYLESWEGDLDRLAVLTPRKPKPADLAKWRDFLLKGPNELSAVLQGRIRPSRNLDVTPDCTPAPCPGAVKALRGLGAKGGVLM